LQIDIDAVSEQVGTNVDLKDIKVLIEIAKPTQETKKVVENSAKAEEFTIIAPPVEFNVRCTYGDKTIDVNRFNSYVERTVAIPEGVDASKITTGVVVENDGTVRHVPTKIVIIDGKYYAKINSLTNSTYSVIWNPREFTDVESHWAKEAVNDMGSRLVISGIDNNLFVPDRDITRAEFAAIVVLALGLTPGMGTNPFTDVKTSDWYYSSIQTASEYSIISGYGNGIFGPMDKITREQAMAMIVNAMNITKLKAEAAPEEIKPLFASFGIEATPSNWAENSVALCVKTGVVEKNDGNIRIVKGNITRAEAAVIVRRLLQKSNLI
jgi:hypothetical protein